MKFKDAELIGVPTIVVVGKGLADGVVEVKDRQTGEREDVGADAVVATVRGSCVADAIEAVIFDWGGTLTPWHTIDLEEEWTAVARAAASDRRRGGGAGAARRR